MNQTTKKQHMVSQMIQRKFSDDNIHVYGIKEILIPQKEIKYEVDKYSIKNTMYKNNCYELNNNEYWLSNNNELSENYFENLFAERENEYSSIVEEIINLINSKESFPKLKKCVSKAMPYFLWFYYRTYNSLLLGIESETNKKKFVNRINNTLLDNQYLARFAKVIFTYYNMHILISPSESFVLSDNFISTASIDFKSYGIEGYSNRTIGFKNIMILIPISAKYYILFTDDKSYNENYRKVYDYEIMKFNSIIYRNSFEFTVGKHFSVLNDINLYVKKYSNKYDLVNGAYIRPEVWVDEIFDKMYYIDSYIPENKINGFYSYVKKDLLERNLEPELFHFGVKLIRLNPNYLNK